MHAVTCYIPQSGNCDTSLTAVGAPQGFSLERLILQGAVRVTWSPPTDLCGLTNPQYTIQYGRTTSTLTTHPTMPSSSPFDITGLEVGQEYFVRVAVRTQSGSGTFSSWESVTPCKGVTICHYMCYCSKLKSTNLTFMFQHVVVLTATSFTAVGAPWDVSLAPLTSQGAVRVTWSPPTDLCGLTDPQYTIQYGRTTSTPTTHPSMPSSLPFYITGLAVGQEYFVKVAVSGSGTFSDWKSVTTCEGV